MLLLLYLLKYYLIASKRIKDKISIASTLVVHPNFLRRVHPFGLQVCVSGFILSLYMRKRWGRLIAQE